MTRSGDAWTFRVILMHKNVKKIAQHTCDAKGRARENFSLETKARRAYTYFVGRQVDWGFYMSMFMCRKVAPYPRVIYR